MAIRQPDDDDDSACETRIINVHNRRVKPGSIRANTEQRTSVTNAVAHQSTLPRLNDPSPSKPEGWWTRLKKLFRW